MYFRYFVIISPWKRAGSFIWTDLNTLHQKMLSANFCLNWPSGSGEEDFSFSTIFFRYIVIISTWENARPFIWTNLNPLQFRMHCAKFGWNWPSGSGKEYFFKISSMYFRYFVIISPWEYAGPFIWTNLNALHLRMLCAKLDWNWPSGSGEGDENVKSLRKSQRRQRQTTDKFLSEKLTWASGSGELKMKYFNNLIKTNLVQY